MRRSYVLLTALLLPAATATAASTAPPRPAITITAKYDWTTYGYDAARTGQNTAESTINRSNVHSLTQKWVTTLSSAPVGGASVLAHAPVASEAGPIKPGHLFPAAPITPTRQPGQGSANAAPAAAAVDASPVGASNVVTSSGTHDLLYVGDERGDFVALDAANGSVVWKRYVGYVHTNCGDFPNGDAGVTAAAALDRATNRVYVPGGDGMLYILDMSTGKVISRWLMSTLPLKNHDYGAVQLDAARHKVYVSLASFCDALPYKGEVESFDTHTGARTTFAVIKDKQNGGGIWGWGGVAMDSAGNVFVATGNALPNGALEATPYAEYVLKLASSNLHVLGAHHPALTGGDSDFGATPALFTPPGCGIPRLAVVNKDGVLFIYAKNNLKAGPIETIPVARKNGGLIGIPAYDAATGTLYISNPNNGARTHGVVALHFNAANHCRTQFVWNTAVGPDAGPMSSPTIANGVLYLNTGIGKQVVALDAATGALLWNSGSMIHGPVFSAPIVLNGRVYSSSRSGGVYAFG